MSVDRSAPFYMIAGGDIPGALQVPRPDHKRGDARFLDTDRRVQIRPLLLSDMVAGINYPPGLWMLVIELGSGLKLRFNLVLPESRRSNTRANARYALRQARRNEPLLQALIDELRPILHRPCASIAR
ncbi:hypothetical protein [Salinarimonas soli]|uniref:Uncharacterized protein n=1 Tax=Salinarimonas soli TaxID=1638099 RepID=A0A5B2V7P1_9HYPH|nr:hypothetical protein [Salinarimonas soli]KAA2235553.1 hypothetical protein F0L46_18795 [Salinarimonas soli]